MAPRNTWRTILQSCFKMKLELLQQAKKEEEGEEDPKINHHGHLLMNKTLNQQQISSRMSLSDINIMSCNNSSTADSNSSSSSSSSIFLSTYLAGSNLHVFTLAELKNITQDFSPATFLGEGGFGPVHKGFLLNHHQQIMIKHGLKPHQPVAVKLLNLQGTQGHKEWLAEIIFLGQLSHPHLVKLIGYCWEDDQRLLIYEYMPGGNLEDQLFSNNNNNNNNSSITDNRVLVLPWKTRLQIALGVAKALAFLHGQDKPVIYRDFKTSNILLDSDFTAKISDFGLAKDGPQGDETHVTTRVMGTHGYAAPEYVMTGHLTKMSDVYSFGVVLLELMTGRKALDKNKPRKEQSLAEWARPFLKDPVKLEGIMDTRLGLKGPPDPDPDHDGPSKLGVAARKTASLAHQCLSQQAKSRPTMLRVVKALETIINLHNSLNNNNNNNFQPHNVYIDHKKDQKLMIKESQEDYKLRNNINIIIDQEEEEEQDQDQSQKKKQRPRRKGYRHKHRLSSLKSRIVSSDTALYPTLVQNDQSLLLYQHNHDTNKL